MFAQYKTYSSCSMIRLLLQMMIFFCVMCIKLYTYTVHILNAVCCIDVAC